MLSDDHDDLLSAQLGYHEPNPLFEGAITRSRAVTLQQLRPEELSSPARAWPVNPPSAYVAPTPEHLSLDFASPEGGTPRRLFDWAESPASVRQPTPGIQRTHTHLQESPWRAVEQHKASSPPPVKPQWRAAVDSWTGGHTPCVPQAPVGAMDASISKLGATAGQGELSFSGVHTGVPWLRFKQAFRRFLKLWRVFKYPSSYVPTEVQLELLEACCVPNSTAYHVLLNLCQLRIVWEQPIPAAAKSGHSRTGARMI